VPETELGEEQTASTSSFSSYSSGTFTGENGATSSTKTFESRGGTSEYGYTSAHTATDGVTFLYQTTSSSTGRSVSGATSDWGGGTSTATASGSVERDTFFYTRITSVSDYEGGVFLGTTAVSSNTDVTEESLSPVRLTYLGDWMVLQRQTIMGSVSDREETVETTFTNITTVTHERWFTAVSNDSVTRISTEGTTLATLTSTREEARVIFGQDTIMEDDFSGYSTDTTEGELFGVDLTRNSVLEPYNSINDRGLAVWYASDLTPNESSAIPTSADPVSYLVELHTSRGETLNNQTVSSSTSVATHVLASDLSDNNTQSTRLTGGFDYEFTYNVFDSVGALTTTLLSNQSTSTSATFYPNEAWATHRVTSFCPSDFPVTLTIEGDSGVTTTTEGVTSRVIMTTVVQNSFYKIGFNIADSGTNSSSSTFNTGSYGEAGGFTLTFTGGTRTGIDFAGLGMEAVPTDAVGIIGQYSRAAGYHPFYASSKPLSEVPSVYRSYVITNSTTDSKFSDGHTSSIDTENGPLPFHTYGGGPNETILDITCPLTASWTTTKDGLTSVQTLTTQVGTQDVEYDIVTYDTNGQSGITLSTSTFPLLSLTTSSTDSVYSVYGTQKWIKAGVSDRAESSRAAEFTIRDERLEEIRGTRTFVLTDRVGATDGDWMSSNLATNSSDSLITVQCGLYTNATLTWRGLHLDVSFTNTDGDSSTTQFVDTGGVDELGSIELDDYANMIIRTGSMVFGNYNAVATISSAWHSADVSSEATGLAATGSV